MNLENQIAQLLIVGFQGDSLAPGGQLAHDLHTLSLGGVILFDRLLAMGLADNNIRSEAQCRKLCADLQDCAGGNLLIAVDQEGGRVSRFTADRGFPATASAAGLGALKGPDLTYKSACGTAGLLQRIGINLNLAPVVDLNLRDDNPIISKYERSFAREPDRVSLHAGAWIQAHREKGILCCLKHFPGHGSSAGDSHLGFVDISETWQPVELEPYRELIKLGKVDAVMLGHLFNSRLDALLPATLSRSTIADLLRRDLGFSGVVISDDLQMRAIIDRYSLPEAAVMALTAGVDILIIGNNLQYDPLIVGKLVAHIVRAIDDGRLGEERIFDAWRRVQQLKNTINRDTPCKQTPHPPIQ